MEIITRIKISAVILSLLILASVVTSAWVNLSCGRIIDDIEMVMKLYKKGSNDEVVIASRQLERDWESFRMIASFFIRSDRLAEVDHICSIISYSEKEKNEFGYKLIEFHDLIEQICDGESLKPNTIM